MKRLQVVAKNAIALCNLNIILTLTSANVMIRKCNHLQFSTQHSTEIKDIFTVIVENVALPIRDSTSNKYIKILAQPSQSCNTLSL